MLRRSVYEPHPQQKPSDTSFEYGDASDLHDGLVFGSNQGCLIFSRFCVLLVYTKHMSFSFNGRFLHVLFLLFATLQWCTTSEATVASTH